MSRNLFSFISQDHLSQFLIARNRIYERFSVVLRGPAPFLTRKYLWGFFYNHIFSSCWSKWNVTRKIWRFTRRGMMLNNKIKFVKYRQSVTLRYFKKFINKPCTENNYLEEMYRRLVYLFHRRDWAIMLRSLYCDCWLWYQYGCSSLLLRHIIQIAYQQPHACYDTRLNSR